MTTIVYRDGILAADTAVFDRGTYCGQAIKITSAPSGLVAGSAGCMGDAAALRDWVLDGAAGDPPKWRDEDSEGILIQNGVVYWIGPGQKKIAYDAAPYIAIGSGFQVAMGALAMGASAERAVEIACDLDNRTRRPVTVLTVLTHG